MKAKHYLAVAVIATLVAVLVKAPDPSGTLMHNRLLEQFMPSVYAQQVGYVGWNNVHMAYLNADFTDANASGAQNIPRLSWALPANQGVAFRINCEIAWSQATVVADNFGIQFSNAPTNALFSGWSFTANTATAIEGQAPVTISGTGATNIITATPTVTTVLAAYIDGVVEQASNATDTTVNINVTQSTAADVIVIKRGSACVWHSMN